MRLMQNESNKLSFKGQDIFIGIDVHLKSWIITIMMEFSAFKTLSINPEAKILRNYLEKNFPGGIYHSAYEAGFTGYSTHWELEKEGIQNIVVNPADIPTTDKDRKQKEDKRDSRKIAKSLKSGDLEGIYIPQIATMELRSLVRYRKTLVKEISRSKNRIKSFLYFNGTNIPSNVRVASLYWSGAFTQWLESLSFATEFGKQVMAQHIKITAYLRSSLLEVNKELRKIKKSGPYSKSINLLCSIPGIGLISAVTLLSEIEDFKRFKNLSRLCSFVGLIPTTNSSGEHDRSGRITPRSNKPIRTVLIESAWIATRNDPALALKFNELCKRMKSNEAIIRIAKKMLNRIRSVMINEKQYEYYII